MLGFYALAEDFHTAYSGYPFHNLQAAMNDSGVTNLNPTALDSFILDFIDSRHVAGLTASIVKDGDVIWTGAYGNARFSPFIPAADSTLFMLASISKTLTGAALMQLYEQGKFDLQDPVNDYLPFEVHHSKYPDTDISFHMLMTHTSGIRDNWDYMPYYPGDSPIPLGEYLENYLVPGGEYYDGDANFTNWEPGTQYVYCNIAVALVGYLVEVIAEEPFDLYCRENLFDPLQMNETSWFLAGLDTMNIAMPYHWNGNEYEPYGYFGYNEYPAGQLRTSSTQLMRFLTAFLLHGELDGERILDSTTVAMMTIPQVPHIYSGVGLIWHTSNIGGRVLWGHGGGDIGVSTLMYFCPDENSAAVVLTNGETYLSQVIDVLLDYAATYPKDLSVELMPHDPPVLIPPEGGEFTFDITISNGDSIEVSFDAWITATLPDGSIFGPIVLRRGVILAPWDTINLIGRSQSVPPAAPPGEYSYTASVGYYPEDIVALDSFTVKKFRKHYLPGITPRPRGHLPPH